jgi:hypothetical protein
MITTQQTQHEDVKDKFCMLSIQNQHNLTSSHTIKECNMDMNITIHKQWHPTRNHHQVELHGLSSIVQIPQKISQTGSHVPTCWIANHTFLIPEEFLIPHQNPKWENSANRKPRARAQEERILSVMRYVKILNVCICFSAFMIMMSTMAIICNENHSQDSKPCWVISEGVAVQMWGQDLISQKKIGVSNLEPN